MAELGKKPTGQLKPVTAGAPAMGQMAGVRRARNPVLAAVGNFLYELGFSAQYVLAKIGRIIRDFALITWQALTILGRWLLAILRGAAMGLVGDLTAPVRHFNQRRRALARAQRVGRITQAEGQERQFARARAGTLAGLLGGLLATYVMPLVAVAVLVFTVFSVVTMPYALAVEYNGRVLGHVADQSVVEGAKTLLRDRIKLADNQELSDWQLNPAYTIARASSFTTASQMANEILLAGGAGPGDIVPATGFYMGTGNSRQLIAVTDEGERLKAYLDGLLEDAQSKQTDGTVQFVGNVEFDPTNEDVFFASSVQSYDEMLEKLNSIESETVRWQADGVTTLGDVAVEHNLGLETLIIRNPQYEGMDGDYVPEEGVSLLIERAKPFLQVQTVVRVESVEPIPYEREERENDERPRGVSQVVQKGVEGEQRVYDDYIYIDGERDSRQRVDELTEIITPAVNEIVEVGTRALQDYLGDLNAAGFIFPVPGYSYSSRGYTPGGHRGLDINAPLGTPIYACESGTVVNAGWHYSFGYYVEIAHTGGVNTLYAHCSALYVSAGQTVAKGTAIGAVGSTGNSTGNHCHLEVTVGGTLTNPVAFVGFP